MQSCLIGLILNGEQGLRGALSGKERLLMRDQDDLTMPSRPIAAENRLDWHRLPRNSGSMPR